MLLSAFAALAALAALATFVNLYITVASMADPNVNINIPFGIVCCDGETIITLLYESIACSTMIANGFVIIEFIKQKVLYLIRLLLFIVVYCCGCVLQRVRRLLFVNPGA